MALCLARVDVMSSESTSQSLQAREQMPPVGWFAWSAAVHSIDS